MIKIDDRESKIFQDICDIFFDKYEIDRLLVGDIIFDDQVCFEHKQPDDFISSVYDGRLFNQIEKMKVNYKYSYIIVSGSLTDIISTPGTNYNSLMAAISSCFVRGCPIIFCDNYENVCDIVKRLSEKLLDGKDRSESNIIKLPIHDDSLRLVCSIPGISKKRGKALLDHFITPIAIFTAFREDLKKVNDIGDKTIDKMYKIIHGDK